MCDSLEASGIDAQGWIDATTPGELTDKLIQMRPELAEVAAFVRTVEGEIRAMYEPDDEPTEATDAAAAVDSAKEPQ